MLMRKFKRITAHRLSSCRRTDGALLRQPLRQHAEMLAPVEVIEASPVELKIEFPATIVPQTLRHDRAHIVKAGADPGLGRRHFHGALEHGHVEVFGNHLEQGIDAKTRARGKPDPGSHAGLRTIDS